MVFWGRMIRSWMVRGRLVICWSRMVDWNMFVNRFVNRLGSRLVRNWSRPINMFGCCFVDKFGSRLVG